MKSNENKKTVILADMGSIRAFTLSAPGTALFPHTGPVTIEEIKLPERQRDPSPIGRFPEGRSVSESAGMSPGESHNEETEFEKKRIEFIARKICDLVEQAGNTPWCFAAPAAINRQILELIPPKLRASLVSNTIADLTHLPLADIEERFLNPPHNH
jgi:hypothetical protein